MRTLENPIADMARCMRCKDCANRGTVKRALDTEVHFFGEFAFLFEALRRVEAGCRLL